MISRIWDLRYERLVETDNTADDNVDDDTDTDETNDYNGRWPQTPAMPLLQCPGPAPDFATHAVVNGNIGHVALKDYQV